MKDSTGGINHFVAGSGFCPAFGVHLGRARTSILAGLLLAATAAAFCARAAFLGASGAGFVVGHFLASLGAHLTGLGASFAADAHHHALATANGDALFAEFGTVQARLHAFEIGLVPLGHHVGAVAVAFEALGQTLGTVGDTLGTAILHFFGFVVGGNGAHA